MVKSKCPIIRDEQTSTSTSSSQTGGVGKEKLLESAAGVVALSSDLIQVSVRAMRFSLED